MRWKIEVFHKILKSGCKAEDSKLHTADRLANLMVVFCILSWRVFWLKRWLGKSGQRDKWKSCLRSA